MLRSLKQSLLEQIWIGVYYLINKITIPRRRTAVLDCDRLPENMKHDY
jgi:hypothetical protein